MRSVLRNNAALFLAMGTGVLILLLVSLHLVRVATETQRGPAARATTRQRPLIREPIQPIVLADASGSDPAKITLGRRLFADRRLSADGSVACSDCHDLARGGADGRALAVGIGGRVGTLNTPTVFNVDANVKQFWDGRADSLEAQIDGPLQHPAEMGSTWPDVVSKIRADRSYAVAFAMYSDGVSPANIKDAIAAYERTLLTPGSRFDAYLMGEAKAITSDELEGYTLFKRYGCISCHQGRNVGGNLFETLGVMGDYFADRGGPITKADLGRFNVTGRPEDRFRFRVPSLRLVTLTAPYFHDGHVQSLEEAVVLMARYQLGTSIPSADVRAIVRFLATLAGTYQGPQAHAGR